MGTEADRQQTISRPKGDCAKSIPTECHGVRTGANKKTRDKETMRQEAVEEASALRKTGSRQFPDAREVTPR